MAATSWNVRFSSCVDSQTFASNASKLRAFYLFFLISDRK